ncbi:hypothetical protein KEM48_012028 [Puccinia striiformis f. sp. tritici PST-130]|nr:hypothetical protein KEM48_012028 [Puccinia striiformis f. sp. tritici PST-130]
MEARKSLTPAPGFDDLNPSRSSNNLSSYPSIFDNNKIASGSTQRSQSISQTPSWNVIAPVKLNPPNTSTPNSSNPSASWADFDPFA